MSGAGSRSRGDISKGREFLPPPAPRSPWVTLFMVVVLLASLSPLILYVYYGTAQRALTLTVSPAGLSVEFGVGRISIPVEDIAGVTYVSQPGRMGRRYGASVAGLKMGWYRLDEYGTVYRLTTAARPVVYVDTRPDARRARPDTRYVFSPEDPERFAELLRTMAAGGRTDAAGSQDGVVFRSAPSPSVFADPLILVSLAVTLPLGLGSVYVVRKGPSTIRYEVDGDGIVVHHLGRRRYRWDSVRGVRRIDGRLSRVRRLMGAALPGYYTGQFTAGELGSLKVYATRLAPPLVLLETRVGKVLISPEDVDGFLAAVAEYRPEGA